MFQKIGYLGLHYLFLLVFIFACWGAGSWILHRISKETAGMLEHALATALGIGFFICILQWLGIAGELRYHWIVIAICLGIGMGVVQARKVNFSSRIRDFRAAWETWTSNERKGLLIVFIFAVSTLLDPLGPPLEWDELMYHLPHAQQWAMTGSLGVHEWLRYPWFPYNYDLLYSAALIVVDDVFPHMLHACAGWLVALIVYQLGKRYANHAVACLGTVIWLFLAHRDFDNAYIDMGITLFVLCSCVAFFLWSEDKKKYMWLAVSAFFIGIATGSKYQALSFLPLFAAALVVHDRKPRVLLLVVICFLVPCIYWYARNGLLTGDPFNPVGGRIFGFADWNISDYKAQFQDLKQRAEWPHFILWAALLPPFIQACRKIRSMQYAMVFCVYSVLVWMVTSHYPRYLMPAFPLLALLAAKGWQVIGRNGLQAMGGVVRWKSHPACARTSWAIVLILLCTALAFDFIKGWRNIAPTDASRNEILEERVTGYKVLSYLKDHPVGKIYQFGLEGVIYYAPSPIWGDHFGPWRYGDFASLNPEQLAHKLKEQGFSDVLIHTGRWPHIVSRPGFDEYFSKTYGADSVMLYRIK